ncbi:predicted protein [Postia placenta Mad-698-R]|nr:predicted protein [Postia placenta Mad-698-R]
MSAHSATPASTPSLVNRRLASLLVVLEAPPTADAALDVVEEWAQDLSPLVLAYRKALGAIRDEETELHVAAAIKQLAERASESWVEWARGDWPELATAIYAKVERRLEEQKRLAEEEARHVEEAAKRVKAAEDRRLEDERRRKDEEERRLEDEHRAQEAADEELARIAAAEGLLSDPAPAGVDKGKGRARVDEEVTELSDDPSVNLDAVEDLPSLPKLKELSLERLDPAAGVEREDSIPYRETRDSAGAEASVWKDDLAFGVSFALAVPNVDLRELAGAYPAATIAAVVARLFSSAVLMDVDGSLLSRCGGVVVVGVVIGMLEMQSGLEPSLGYVDEGLDGFP